MDISVVITSHNRPENLLITLNSLYESIKSKIDVLILVEPNSDSLPQDKDLKPLKNRLNLYFSTNKFSLGCDESIVRTFEYFDSQWIYFLGDSKPLLKDAFKTIKKQISLFPNAKAHFFHHNSKLTAQQKIYSVRELANSGINLGDFILGGNFLFSREIINDFIKFSYRTMTSRIGHSAIAIMALEKNLEIILSEKRIIDRFLEKPARYNPGDEWADCWASFSLLCLLPISYKNARELNKFIVNSYSKKDLFIFSKYILLKLFRHNQKDISKLLKQIISTRYIFYCNYLEKFVIIILFLFVRTFEIIFKR